MMSLHQLILNRQQPMRKLTISQWSNFFMRRRNQRFLGLNTESLQETSKHIQLKLIRHGESLSHSLTHTQTHTWPFPSSRSMDAGFHGNASHPLLLTNYTPPGSWKATNGGSACGVIFKLHLSKTDGEDGADRWRNHALCNLSRGVQVLLHLLHLLFLPAALEERRHQTVRVQQVRLGAKVLKLLLLWRINGQTRRRWCAGVYIENSIKQEELHTAHKGAIHSH